jgi:hypothetical protein
MPGWATGRPSGDPRMEFWMRFADGREADLAAVPLLMDAAAPAVLELGAPGSATLELTVHLRGRPAPGWLACRMSTRYVTGGLIRRRGGGPHERYPAPPGPGSAGTGARS